MINTDQRVAVITSQAAIADHIRVALKDLFDVDTFKNGLALHHAMEKTTPYKAIITDDELLGANGIPLRKTLSSFGYGKIPFMVVMNQIDNEQRNMAMSASIAEIFSKPIDQNALRTRIPYLVENYNSKTGAAATALQYKLPLIKRIFDITFSGLALLMLSPLFLIIAILVRAESKGPVFYYSLRVGSGYKVFKFYKFRSMFTGADAKLKDLSHLNQYNLAKTSPVAEEPAVKELCEFCEQAGTGCINPLYADNKVVCETLYNQQKESNVDSAFIKIKNDPRITRIGNFIRNTSIDELPQLWNVFIGDMSIVGNRPLPLYEAEKITTDKYALRFMAPAGITGLWQVEKRGRGEMSEGERLNLDNNYAKTHSFANDIRLIMRTIPALFQSENV
ncbi:MAG: response regulator receiver protein [Ferruginibacter sp.]|uniref:sugar transferase n=1 Tax=Ferruginibacter sp. TaxID=1940288 RepID=UPI00265A67E5|nr:sugar transferase [Ferruginibacter sp.]MDB5275824.1 response regulator receiver protein [Ferruginibacter sp.]